jgi:four helix bundle protein
MDDEANNPGTDCRETMTPTLVATLWWGELYGITSQMRRAALSVPTNIVEGAARKGSPEFRRFLDISWASLAELRYHVLFSHEMGFLSAEQRVELERLGVRTAKLLWGLHKTVTRRARES